MIQGISLTGAPTVEIERIGSLAVQPRRPHIIFSGKGQVGLEHGQNYAGQTGSEAYDVFQPVKTRLHHAHHYSLAQPIGVLGLFTDLIIKVKT